MTQLNINALRDDTVGCRHVLHFNNAGAALLSKPIVNAIKNHLDLESSIGGYEAAQVAFKQTEKFYVVVQT